MRLYMRVNTRWMQASRIEGWDESKLHKPAGPSLEHSTAAPGGHQSAGTCLDFGNVFTTCHVRAASLYIWSQQRFCYFWRAYLSNGIAFITEQWHPPQFLYIGVLQQKLTEVLGNLIILTEFCKFHTPRQVLYILCSFAVNKFVFPCLPLSCVVPFETAPLYLVTDRSSSPGGNFQLDMGNDLLV